MKNYFLLLLFVLFAMTACDNTTNIFDAAENGNYKKVKEYLDAGVDPNIYMGDIPEYKEKGLHPMAKNYTPIMLAIQYPDIVKLLLEYGANPNYVSTNGTCSIQWALLMIDDPDVQGNVIDLLLNHGAKFDTRNSAEILRDVIVYGSPEIMRKLIEAGADCNASFPRTSIGASPYSSVLYYAQDYDIGFTKVLCECTSDEKKIKVIATTDNSPKRTYILESVSDFQIPCDDYGNTLLHDAAEDNDTELVEFLIKKGADVNAVGSYDETPLMCACGWTPCLDCVKLLIKAGADPYRVNRVGDNIYQILNSMIESANDEDEKTKMEEVLRYLNNYK